MTDAASRDSDPHDRSSTDRDDLVTDDERLSPAEVHAQLRNLRDENATLKKTLSDLSTRMVVLQREYEEFQSTYQGAVNRLVIAAEYQDDTVDRHIRRMGRYTAFVAEKSGLCKEDVRRLELASPMHDIGKAGIPRSILMKQGRLTDEEFTVVKNHTVIGGNMLGHSESPLLNCAREIILSHHEQWDGSGYPVGSRGRQIPLSGRIVGLVDTYDALTSRRPHKSAYPVDLACDIIFEQRGRRFDPDLVDLIQGNLDSLIRIKAEVEGPENLPNSHFSLSERDRQD